MYTARWRLLLHLLYPPWLGAGPSHPLDLAVMVLWVQVGALGTMPAPGQVTVRQAIWARHWMRSGQTQTTLAVFKGWMLYRPT